MASLSFLVATANSTPLYIPSKHSSSSTPTRRFYTCCENKNTSADTADTTDHNKKKSESGSSLRFDRRNVLLGLGGLYGASALAGRGNMAIGAPIALPDLSKCHLADGGTTVGKVQCCPPYDSSTEVVDYEFLPTSKPLRVRKPAHLLEKDEIEKYQAAMTKLRELTESDPDDPRGWMQQANVHCQYCNGAFDQVGFDSVLLQVHYSWLFLPWHRWYLHFHERILGSLIDDDTFALPFWNWDTPVGMRMPPIFSEDTTSSLYDSLRNPLHAYPATFSLDYSYYDAVPSTPEEIQAVEDSNLLEISTAFKESLALPELFMGDTARAGETVSSSTNSAGQLETIHNKAHQWTGPDDAPYMNMGNFYSAARDPIFYCHHSNVDRMWQIYRSMRGYKTEFDDTDWLQSTFLFVDENKQLVKVNIADCMNPLKLRYTYEEVPLPWADTGLRKRLIKVKAKPTSSESLTTVTEFGSEARALTSTIRVLVKRPKQSRSKKEKEGALEVLFITGIEAPIFQPSRFDVYVTTPDADGQVTAALGELAGSFVKLPHHGKSQDDTTPKTKTARLKLGITTLLEDLEAESAESLVVSLVPRIGEITVGGVSIELLDTGA